MKFPNSNSNPFGLINNNGIVGSNMTLNHQNNNDYGPYIIKNLLKQLRVGDLKQSFQISDDLFISLWKDAKKLEELLSFFDI
ncbi:hypothetical protein Ahy_B03g062455 isoform B [Arachis hypogaea]|uniref:Uncharacterized protein n=1 Tax=Arachis hypogaea TaxID=3818 RepID=A0A444ZU65_ARAHY|nr:hypothetical protein Ahy_B03g062455 isoform B [Arachis hypogaea]